MIKDIIIPYKITKKLLYKFHENMELLRSFFSRLLSSNKDKSSSSS